MQTVTTTHGTWRAELYEIASSQFEYDAEDGWCDSIVGVNIKLSFMPTRKSARIRLLALKHPLHPPTSYATPWMGFDNQQQPITLQGNIRFLQSLQPLVGTSRTQEGIDNTTPDFIIDTVREPMNVPQEGKKDHAVITTFAYEFTSSTWLGGVSWGYTLCGPSQNDGNPRIYLDDLTSRLDRAPHELRDEEGKAIAEWNNRKDVERVPDA
jgi:hypothetical protein